MSHNCWVKIVFWPRNWCRYSLQFAPDTGANRTVHKSHQIQGTDKLTFQYSLKQCISDLWLERGKPGGGGPKVICKVPTQIQCHNCHRALKVVAGLWLWFTAKCIYGVIIYFEQSVVSFLFVIFKEGASLHYLLLQPELQGRVNSTNWKFKASLPFPFEEMTKEITFGVGHWLRSE